MIPADVRSQVSMLASQSKSIHTDLEVALSNLITAGTFMFDLKIDGIRCKALIDHGVVTLINRVERDITFRYPEVVAALASTYPDTEIVLDGEIAVLKDDGTPNFAEVHRRDAQENAQSALALSIKTPATFMVFDILYYMGDDLRRQPYIVRNTLLKKLVLTGSNVQVVPSSRDGAKMWAFVKEHKLEGLIAKRVSGLYVGGRSPSWIKLKPVRSVSAIVSGTDQGEGARASTFGALHLVLLGEDNTMVSIGKVGSGFDNKDLALVLERISAGRPLVVEVEFQDVSADKKLRFPVFKGIRDDVNLLDCTVDQLDSLNPKPYIH